MTLGTYSFRRGDGTNILVVPIDNPATLADTLRTHYVPNFDEFSAGKSKALSTRIHMSAVVTGDEMDVKLFNMGGEVVASFVYDTEPLLGGDSYLAFNLEKLGEFWQINFTGMTVETSTRRTLQDYVELVTHSKKPDHMSLETESKDKDKEDNGVYLEEEADWDIEEQNEGYIRELEEQTEELEEELEELRDLVAKLEEEKAVLSDPLHLTPDEIKTIKEASEIVHNAQGNVVGIVSTEDNLSPELHAKLTHVFKDQTAQVKEFMS